MDWLAELFGVAVIVLMIAGCLWARAREKQDWNNGRCLCGQHWEHFDNDSQGGRGYVCRNHKPVGRYIWISYPGVDRDCGRPTP